MLLTIVFIAMLANHGKVPATDPQQDHVVNSSRMVDVSPDDREVVQLLKSLQVPRVDWNEEKLEDALEFLKLKIEALHVQGVQVPSLTYRIEDGREKKITLRAASISYWGVMEHLRRRGDLEVTIEATRIHIESQ